MLLRVIAHQIACFASDRRALTVFCVTSVHFYAAFLLFAGRESGSGGPGGPRRPRVPRPAPPRQAPALTHTPPTGALQPVTVIGPPAPRVSFPCSFLTLFTRGVSSPLCETLFSHVFSAYSLLLFSTTLRHDTHTVQHRHDVKSTTRTIILRTTKHHYGSSIPAFTRSRPTLRIGDKRVD